PPRPPPRPPPFPSTTLFRSTVAASVDLVVHVGTDASGHRRVREIVALPGPSEGGVIETADIFTTREGRLVRSDGYPPHAERFSADRKSTRLNSSHVAISYAV